MPVNPNAVGCTSSVCERTWTPADTMLYALSIGAGAEDPTGTDLQFVTENSTGIELVALPTFAVILGSGVPGLTEHFGTYDKSQLVHAEQSVELHAPLPPLGCADVQASVVGVYDKGTAAIIETRTTAKDTASGSPLFTTGANVFIRGEGGWGGDRGPATSPIVPDREPDAEAIVSTRPDQALLYRLNGDRNPLHSDPVFAARGGFDRPILHGLCTFGITGRVLLRELCADDVNRFVGMSGRFSRPVFPGEKLTVAIWRLADGTAAVRTTSSSGEVVLDRGSCRIREEAA